MHRVLRQVVEVEMQGSERDALSLQRRIVDVLHQSGSAHLEAAFAPFDNQDRYILIERLDVDLGDIPLERMYAALTEGLAHAVAAKLRESDMIPIDGADRPAALGLSRPEAVIRAVLYFLCHGRLPWWFAAEASPLESQFLTALAESDDGERRATGRSDAQSWLTDLARTLSNSSARERLVSQFSASTVLAVLDLIDHDLHREVWRVLRSRRIPAGGALRHRFELSLLEVALEAAVGALPFAGKAHEDTLRRAAVLRLAPHLGHEDRHYLARSAEVQIDVHEVQHAAMTNPERPADEAVVDDGLPVENAGIVLLHPFLPRFFEHIGIARDQQLLNPSRAALLLHHLATGALTAEEHTLVLAKVLCGIPIEGIVDREAPVTPEEQTEAAALLESAVRHWEVLRGTSADGLRGNFLVRRGRLELGDRDWVLRVERSSVDVLLEHLPWGIAHVKLPWMSRLMRVEWLS